MIKSKTNISFVNCDDKHDNNDGKYDDDFNNINVFGIPLHNNAFAHLKVHDGCQEQHGEYDVISVDVNNTDLCRKVLINDVCKQKCSGNNTSKEHVNVVNITPKNTGNFNSSCKTKYKVKGLNVSHMNVQSLIPCFDEIKIWLKDNPYDVFTLSEKWLDSTIHDSEIKIPGYVIERTDRNRHGGGVAIYIKDDIHYIRRCDIENINDTGSVWLEIKQIRKKPIVIGSLYCRSQSDVPEYLDLLSEIMDDVTNDNKEIILLGDLNCDFLKKNPVTSHMSSFMNMYNLDQLVTKPTRITPNSKTLIDVILTTDCNICVDTDVVHHSFSGHSLVHTTVLCNENMKGSTNTNHVTKQFRSFKDFNVDNFVKDLNNVDWDIHDSSSATVAWDSFVSKFKIVCNKHAPVKSIRFRQKSCPWLDHRDDIFNVMHERDYHHKKAIHSKDGQTHHWNEYRVLRNKVNTMMKEAKRDYYTNKINDSAGNMSNMWKTLKELLPNKKGNLANLPSVCNSNMELANEFNKHFTNVGTASALSSISSREHDHVRQECNTFIFSEISIDEVIDEVIDELNAISQNKASGLDGISTKLIKYGTKAIAPILCKIF